MYSPFENLENAVGCRTDAIRDKRYELLENLENVVGYKNLIICRSLFRGLKTLRML